MKLFKSKKKKVVTLSKREVKNELDRLKYKSKYKKVLSNTLYVIIILAAISIIISTLLMPVLQISGKSMEPNFSNGDIVISVKTKNLKQEHGGPILCMDNNNDIVVALKTSKVKKGDIIAFYQGNKILVKRVISTSGQYVNINEDGNVFIDGKILEEKYIKNKQLGDADIEFPYQVPNESYFVLSDDRNNMIDSRTEDVGAIKKDDIVGKVLFRILPIK